MLVVASTNGRAGIVGAMEVLRRGGSALDAVEFGVRAVESDPADHSVGYSGLPNVLGEVELDASIVDGSTLAAGAVGALQGFEHAISIARKVMEELPHVFLVGEGAARFAAEMGFPSRDLLTEEARQIWQDGLARRGIDYGAPGYLDALRQRVRITADPGKARETVNFIAVDGRGNVASGVSTSGWAWKYPGRLGDSPVIGAGNYADTRYGAAACTGRGEMALRLCAARSVVLSLKHGMSLHDACVEAMAEIRDLPDDYHSGFGLIAVNARGEHLGVGNRAGETYVSMTDCLFTLKEITSPRPHPAPGKGILGGHPQAPALNGHEHAPEPVVAARLEVR